MSGDTDHAALRAGALPAGAAFVQKPFVADALVCRVRALLEAMLSC